MPLFPLVALLACGDVDSSGDGPVWYGQVDAVITQNCVGCHVSGGIGTFSLDDYEELDAADEEQGYSCYGGPGSPDGEDPPVARGGGSRWTCLDVPRGNGYFRSGVL